MLNRYRTLGTALILICTIMSVAEAASYRNFKVAIYCRVDDVKQMSDTAWLNRNYEMLSRYLKIDHVYLETHRDGKRNDRETMLKAKQFFESHGVRTSGGITTVANEGMSFKTFCYTNPKDREWVKETVKFTAGLFDEFILDDFFFTNCKCDSCIKAKGNRSWAEFRLDLMKEVSENLVLKPAREVNPRVKVIIKYPNWYDHYQFTGYNLESEPKAFDSIYTGTETRDAQYTDQHLQEYQSYSIMRFLENVKPGLNGGGWVDPYGRQFLDKYGEQLALTLFSKSKEVTLFCFSALLQPVQLADGTELPASEVAPVAGTIFDRLDAFLGKLGNPVGVSSYKPFHSSGEDYIHSYLGMIGIPIELAPEFRDRNGVIFLSDTARFDPAIIEKMKKQLADGKTVVVTSGLIKALQAKGLKDIADLEVTDKKVVTSRFSDFGNVYKAEREIVLPQMRYATNDSWEDVSALDGTTGYPVLHHADYGKGRLYVITVPDNFSDFYNLPPDVLTRIRQVVTKDIPVYLAGPAKISLFAYDNNTMVVHSFLPHNSIFDVVVRKPQARLVDLTTGQKLEGITRGEETVFRMWLEPHTDRAYRWE